MASQPASTDIEGNKRKRPDDAESEEVAERPEKKSKNKEGKGIPMHRRQNSRFLGKHTELFQTKPGVLVCCQQGRDAQAVTEAKKFLEAAAGGAYSFRAINSGCSGLLFFAACPPKGAKDSKKAEKGEEATDTEEKETADVEQKKAEAGQDDNAPAAAPTAAGETMDVLVERMMKGFHATAAAAGSSAGPGSVSSLPRHCLRFLPILATCKAELGVLKETAKRMLEQHFDRVARNALSTSSAAEGEQKAAGEEKQVIEYAVVYRNTNNEQLQRAEVIDALAQTVAAIVPNTKVNLKSPKVSLLVWILKSSAVLGLAANYKETRYTLVPPIPPKQKKQTKDGEQGQHSATDQAGAVQS